MFVESINDTGPKLGSWADEPVGTVRGSAGGHSNQCIQRSPNQVARKHREGRGGC